VLSLPIAVIVIIAKVNEAKARKEWVAFANPRWQGARRLWNELYYCARNDIVFLPGEQNAYAPASEMERLLYSRT
jgi:hypothetical protein